MNNLILFKNIVAEFVQMPDSEIETIFETLKYKKFRRNTLLLNNGDVCKSIYFILNGCLRNYYISSKGEERTRRISFENQFITVFTSIAAQRPSSELIETLEDSEVLIMNYVDFYRLVDKIQNWEIFYRKILEDAFIYQNIKIEELVTLSAGERYKKVLEQNPKYIQRLSNRVLSTYLNISQETLSRLKSK